MQKQTIRIVTISYASGLNKNSQRPPKKGNEQSQFATSPGTCERWGQRANGAPLLARHWWTGDG
eukprot:5928868-Pyramimonas_sp.AAC.1